MEIGLRLGGLPVRLFDTAGLRVDDGGGAVDAIELEGMKRAASAAEAAHIVVFVVDASETDDGEALAALDAVAPALARDPKPQLLVVANKVDVVRDGVADRLRLLDEAVDAHPSLAPLLRSAPRLETAATDADGAAALVEALEERVVSTFRSQASQSDYEAPARASRAFARRPSAFSPTRVVSSFVPTTRALQAITRERHRGHVAACLGCLRNVLDDPYLMPELVAEELRAATDDLVRRGEDHVRAPMRPSKTPFLST